MRGPVTALRVLGQGFEVLLDPDRAEFSIGRDGPPVTDVRLPLPSISSVHARLSRRRGVLEVTDLGSKNGIAYPRVWLSQSPHDYIRCDNHLVNVGDRFALGSVHLLALDEPTHRLVAPLTAYCGPGGHEEVDRALEAILRSHMIILCGTRGDEVIDLARTLHDHSIRRGYPFTRLDAAPVSDEAAESLCTKAGCGTIFVDLTRPFQIPRLLVRNLFSDHFHLWTIVVAPSADEVFPCFGQAWHEPKRGKLGWCQVGFSRHEWHRHVKDVRFTKR